MAEKERSTDNGEQNDGKGAPQQSTNPNHVTGVEYLASVYRPTIIVDSHMHIMSGNCSPLPFLWKQLADKTIALVEAFHLQRTTIEGAGLLIGEFSDFFNISRDQVEVPGTGGTETESRRHAFRQSVPESGKSTLKIADGFIKKRHKDVYGHMLKEKFYEDAQAHEDKPRLFLLCMAMPMDMEFAHLDGYYGLKVYNAILEYDKVTQQEKIIHYWMPLHGRLIKEKRDGNTYYQSGNPNPLADVTIDAQTSDQFKKNKGDIKKHGLPGIYCEEKDGIINKIRINVKAAPCIVPDSETTLYENWDKQVRNTELAMLANPLKLLPLYHYDPRRWQVTDTYNAHPFTQVTGSGLYIGFKMYTAQGYRPWDVYRLPVLKNFYRDCCLNNIPVLNHCTPGGAYNFDRQHFFEFNHPSDAMDPEIKKKKAQCNGDGIKYFNDNYISPKAWDEVLDQEVGDVPLNTLRLCLAHFGGGTDLGLQWCKDIVALMKKYDNVYADISSSMADETKHEKTKEMHKDRFKRQFKEVVYNDPEFEKTLRHRILFGTDWYMTLLDRVEYLEYCRETKKFLDDLDTSLWMRFTQVNPYEFYRLKDENQIGRIRDSIIYRRQNDEDVLKELDKLKSKDINQIKDNAAYIQAANDPYEAYSEKAGKK